LTLTDYFAICHHANLITTAGIACFGPDKGKTCALACFAPGLDLHYFSKRLRLAKHILSNAAAVTAPSDFLAARIKREFPS